MLPQEIIRAQARRRAAVGREIAFFVAASPAGDVTEGQVAAFAMAVFFNGMATARGRGADAGMRDSGTVLDWSTCPARWPTSIPPAVSATMSR